MSDRAQETLLHPFERGMVEMPGGPVLFMGARQGLRLPENLAANLACVQPFRPAFLALRHAGLTVQPAIPDGRFDAALVLVDRHRGRGERWLASALRCVVPGGLVMVGGANDDGASSFVRRIAGVLPVEERASKHHGTVCWLRRPDDTSAALHMLDGHAAGASFADGFETAPGMFSHGRIDPGSALLAKHLPTALSGEVADFGAGWGFLSVAAARRAQGVSAISLFEADHDALLAARANLARLAPGVEASFHWHDLVSEDVPRRFDAVVMNPPFHEGRAADPALGAAFIQRAAQALKPGGRLHLVANRALPYEPTLAAAFAASGEIARDRDFKVLWARR